MKGGGGRSSRTHTNGSTKKTSDGGAAATNTEAPATPQDQVNDVKKKCNQHPPIEDQVPLKRRKQNADPNQERNAQGTKDYFLNISDKEEVKQPNPEEMIGQQVYEENAEVMGVEPSFRINDGSH